MDMGRAIVEVFSNIPNPNKIGTSLYSEDEYEGTYCCLTCKREMKRIYFPLKNRYVMPGACKCDVIRMEREQEIEDRKQRRALLEKAYKRSIMSDTLKQSTFDTFIIRQGTEHCFTEARSMAEGFGDRREGLLMFGKPGNGKSHLAAAIHHHVDAQGYVSLFLDIPQLFNIAKDTFKSSSKLSLTDIITAAIDCDLLTLDELGSGILTETEFNDILFPIVNGRQGKKTNYTSNLDIGRLRNWFAYGRNKEPLDVDGRLIDRMLGSCIILENRGTSKRQEDAMKRMGG